MNHQFKVGDLIYDADIYDAMNTSLDDLAFYDKWMPQFPDAKILELCCGSGRLTVPLAQKGYDITGVDIMPSMLKRAKSKAIEEGMNIKFIESDIRELDLQEAFDLVFIPFNSIHHLYTNEDFTKVLSNVTTHLKPQGKFIFDCFNPNINYIIESSKKEMQIAEYKTSDGREVIIKQKMRYESHYQVNRIEWSYYIDEQFHSVQNLDMRMYYPKELNFLLETNGFNIIKKFGDFNEGPFNSDSQKQIFVCKL